MPLASAEEKASAEASDALLIEAYALLESLGEETSRAQFPVHVSPALLERISGPDLALPNLHSAVDLAIVDLGLRQIEQAAHGFDHAGATGRLEGFAQAEDRARRLRGDWATLIRRSARDVPS